MLACSELGYRWFDQPLEVGVADAHGVGMGALALNTIVSSSASAAST